MEPFKIKDNSALPKSDFYPVQNLVNKIADKTMRQLEQEGVFVFPQTLSDIPDMEEDQIILQSHNQCYRTSNIMGFVGCGSQRLIIQSRFSTEGKDYFFQYLLERVMEYPNIVDMNVSSNQENLLFNLLLFLFPRYLKNALRKGLFKTYICKNYNDSHVTGQIDVARHITENTPFVGKIAYRQREYSCDNALTQLVRHTIEFIRRKKYGRQLLASVKDEVALIVNATPQYAVHDLQKVLSLNSKKPLRHAYYREYRNLQHLCVLILQHQRQQIGTGSRQIYGLLFDGAWLWEEYVHLLIEDSFYHPRNKAGKGAQRLFAGKTGLIYPDFISRDSQNRTIGDAKYKPAQNIGNRDYLQLLAYMLRFDAQTGFYFYPDTQQSPGRRLQVNKGSTYEGNVEPRNDLCVIKLGLHIPLCNGNYQDFAQEMQRSENSFQADLSAHTPPPLPSLV